MKLSGIIFLIFSWGVIIGLCIYCFMQIFRTQSRNIVYPLEVEAEIEEKEKEERRKDIGA